MQHAPRPWSTASALLGVLVGGGLLVGAWFGLLHAINPVGHEWICSQGQAPAGRHGRYDECFSKGRPLPAGLAWDPFGNRPMAYNCEEDGWVLVEHRVTRRGASDMVQDCVREGTALPAGWRPAREH